MGKHAYLVMAHKDDFTFRTLLKLLDDARNDIFVHMDRKNSGYNQHEVESLVQKAGIFHTRRRMNIRWGGHSQIQLEIMILEEATAQGIYDYYHLLSGEDLPIKTQDEIHNFYAKNAGKEFLNFQSEEFLFHDRVQLYHPFRNIVGRSESQLQSWNYRMLEAQKKLHIRRNKDVQFQKGANWFSITDELARYTLRQKRWIRKVFCYSHCGDEIFLQTIVVNSKFRERLYHPAFDDDHASICRLVDWKRGTPYVFRYEDKEEIMNSSLLFARKFDCMVDKEIISFIAEHVG